MPTSIRLTLRRLGRAPGFTAAAILTLALGLGGLTLAFSVVHGVILRPLPYHRSDRLVSLSHTLVVGRPLYVGQSDASLLFYRDRHQAFSAFAGYQATAASVAPSNGPEAERVSAALVTRGFFETFRVSPVAGRLLAAGDDEPSSARVAVLAERLWERTFGRDPGVLQRPLRINGVAHEVVGVVSDSLRFPSADTEVWLPLRLDAARTDSATFDYLAVARLRDGVTLEAAEADLQTLLLRLPAEVPGRLTSAAIAQTSMRTQARPLEDVIVGDVRALLWLGLGAALFVLAIACTNIVNLFLARGEARRSALEIELALGAARRTVFVQFLLEGLVVGLSSVALAVACAAAGLGMLRPSARAVDLPRLGDIRVDLPTIAVASLAALAAALLASAIPAVRTAAGAAPLSVRFSGRLATSDRSRHRGRRALVALQMALAVVLLTGSGLMGKSVWRLRTVEPGFEPRQALTFRLAVPAPTYETTEIAAGFYHRLVGELARLPGVSAAAAVSKLPLDVRGATDTAVFVESRPLEPGALPGIHPVVYTTAGYFAAAGIALLEGRSFTTSDPPRVALEVVVSRAFAERYWGDLSPLGQRVRIFASGPWYTVVGQVTDVRNAGLDRPADEVLYCPILPPPEDPRWAPRDLALILRTAGEPAGATAAVRDVVRRLDPSLAIYQAQPMRDLLIAASARREATFAMITAASVVALALGAIGLFGVMSYVIALRRREIAIRLALGARPARLRRGLVLEGLRPAFAGAALGVAVASLLTQILTSWLYNVRPLDPAVLSAGVLTLLSVAALASWIPARRAAAVEPNVTLRAE